MKKTKLNPELLREELNRFKLLESYSFYTEKQEPPVYGDDMEKPLILGNELEEADENPEDAVDAISNDLGVDPNVEGGDQPVVDPAAPVDAPVDQAAPVDATAAPIAPEAPIEPEVPVEPASDDVEVDVTSLVTGSEEAKAAADRASQNSEMLLQKLDDLEARIANMDRVSAKIDSLEQEMVKRNPTPAEKLDLQSLHSGPYTQKLSDYWSDKEGMYDVMDNDKKQEYTLTKDDVDADYSDTDIKKSFNANPEDEYEEEEF